MVSLRDILDREGAGKGEVMVVSRIGLSTDTNAATEVETRLGRKYKVSNGLAQAIKAIPGVAEVSEI